MVSYCKLICHVLVGIPGIPALSWTETEKEWIGGWEQWVGGNEEELGEEEGRQTIREEKIPFTWYVELGVFK